MTSPITVLLAGPPGIGKTSAALRALGKAAFWVTTEKGALVFRALAKVAP